MTQSKKNSSVDAELTNKEPIYLSIKTKMMMIFLIISIIPILIISIVVVQKTKISFQDQTNKLLTLAADNTEGHILTFLEKQKVRISDWASDGKFRAGAEAIIQTGDAESIRTFSIYVRDHKMIMDPIIKITDVFDLSGRIAFSSDEKRIGKMHDDLASLEREYGFITAKNSAFGVATIGGVVIREHGEYEGQSETPMIRISAPIFSITTGELVGVVAIHISGDELNKILSGARQIELGAPTGGIGKLFGSMETYLVNRDGLMITPSLFVDNAVLKQKVFTNATRACIEDGREISGRYKNYLGVWVYGASMCPQNHTWMLLLEIDEKEILFGMNQVIMAISMTSIMVIIVLTLIAFWWGSHLIRRINEVNRVVDKIKQHNFNDKVVLRGNDEITSLGADINAMSGDLKKYIEQIKTLDVMKQNFIQIVSTQLRAPLTSIRWNLEILMEEGMGKLTKEQKEFVRLTYVADTTIIKRISDLLTAMDIEEGRMSAIKSGASLEGLLTSVIVEYKKDFEMKKEIAFEYIPPATSLPIISIDSDKIRQVFVKLIENALIYTQERGQITAKLFQKGDSLRFELIDTGVGIPAAEQHKIFTKFYRASNAIVMMPATSGLGLAIAKYYVEQHDGNIGFTSEEGKGSTFWFELPIN